MTDECIHFEQHADVLGLEETDSIEAFSDLTVNNGFDEDVEDVEDPDGFYLDSDDNTDYNDDAHLLIEEERDCVLEEYRDNVFEYDELDYSKYNMIPISVDHADEVALTLDKLVTNGKIQKDGIFYKYLKDVLQVYVTPTNYSWDPEVIEFFKTQVAGRPKHCKYDKRTNVAWFGPRGCVYLRKYDSKFRWSIRPNSDQTQQWLHYRKWCS